MIIKTLEFNQSGVCTLVRGDTAQFSLDVYVQGIELEEYNATFSVKQYPDDDSYLFQVNFNQSTPCYFTRDLTQSLPYGDYWYDVQVTYVDDTGSTQYKTIGAFPFILKPDITGN
jgi:hypothetical protein